MANKEQASGGRGKQREKPTPRTERPATGTGGRGKQRSR